MHPDATAIPDAKDLHRKITERHPQLLTPSLTSASSPTLGQFTCFSAVAAVCPLASAITSQSSRPDKLKIYFLKKTPNSSRAHAFICID
jgi:hypothetical protein